VGFFVGAGLNAPAKLARASLVQLFTDLAANLPPEKEKIFEDRPRYLLQIFSFSGTKSSAQAQANS
jgi:hypothetical protein